MNIQDIIDIYENYGYGVMFVDMANTKMVPYDLFTEEEMEKITSLYFVKMTQEIFENGLDNLDNVSYVKIQVQEDTHNEE